MRALAFVMVSLLASATASAAYGDAAEVTMRDCGNTPGGGYVTCLVDANGNVVQIIVTSAPAKISTSAGGGSSGVKYVPYDRVVVLPDGGFCVTTGYHEEGVTPVDGTDSAPGAHPGGNGFNNKYDLAPCSASPGVVGGTAPVVSVEIIATHYWQQIPLPIPAPSIAPGRAITGKTAYLETRGETNHAYTNDTFVGPLNIVAHGTYMVDWGDGTTTGPYRIEGAPWPNGQITHDYVQVGSYNVIVTENWTATWTLDGGSGVLQTLQTSGRIDNFPVQQIQAVIGS